ncbi:transcriptional activator Mut3p [Fusarium tjaetaba]|uniref:Transcriptional activator Mut3p n=1 Tax=Fusarium tjaetaba TaxID=1567544 RepID=A0A8H5S1A3_9HYPO|nr:transcriptional activator Mut3p [Fusarium tjaetaba]KAF5642292.1 transcriptional activator Mut3p [Fusarium tjaetaba]
MAIIAVAGGAGKLGRAIVEAIVEQGQHTVVILAREAKDVQGAKVVSVDYANTDELAATLEANSIETVISTINSMDDVSAELSLIKAAEKSGSTKRYIPSIWGIKNNEEIASYFPIARAKLNVIAALEATSSLEYTTVYVGYFSDYWVLPKVKSYQSPLALVVDIENNFAAIPGSGNELVTFTHTFDVARFVAVLVGASKWDKESYIIGDKVSWNQFVQYAEEAKGVKFTVKHDSIEDLKAGKITELPSHVYMYPFFPKPMLQGLFAAFGRMFIEGAFDLKPERTLNESFPEIKARKIKDLLFEAWGQCLNRKTTCHYGERKGRGRGKSKQYITTLEQRLKNVEVALQAVPTVSHDSSQVSTDAGHPHEVTPGHGTSTTDETQSLPSRWPEEVTRKIIDAQKNNINLERKVFVPLPPKEHILHFISNSLADVYEAQALFSSDDVLKVINDQYSAGPSNCHANPTRWATLNALIATGIHWKADNKAIKEMFPVSWSYFKNAFAIFPEIVMNGGGIDECQAMIAMALFMRGTADSRALTALLSAAAHAGHCIGLGLEGLDGSNDLIGEERRKRSFWTLYVLRCNASLNLNLPAPSDEVSVELPSQGLITDDSSSIHLLRSMSTLAQIQSRISRCCRPGSSLSKSSDEMIQALAEIDTDLESWRTGLPTEVQARGLIQVDNLGIIQLHFAYYASTWKIYAAIGKLYDVPLTSIEREHPNLHLILHDHEDSEVSLNVEWIGQFVAFLQTFQHREGCNLSGLIEFCSKLYDIASFAQRNPTDVVNDGEDDAGALQGQYTGLLTNMPLLGKKAMEVFHDIVAETREDGFTPLVPNVLKPSSFNFFGYSKAATEH